MYRDQIAAVQESGRRVSGQSKGRFNALIVNRLEFNQIRFVALNVDWEHVA